MKNSFPLTYRAVQRIKAEEYDYFFSNIEEFDLYLNHLGEVRWMSTEEARDQHEFYIYEESFTRKLRRKLTGKKHGDLSKMSVAEREIRLHFRNYLASKKLGFRDPSLEEWLPMEWKYEIDEEYLNSIPISTDVGKEKMWKMLAIGAGLVLIVATAIFLWFYNSSAVPTGNLLVRGDIPGARIFLDETEFLGYNNKVIHNVPTGLHRITASKDGHHSIPTFYEIDILPDTLTTLAFQFQRAYAGAMGYLWIHVPQNGSKLFVDQDFRGEVNEGDIIELSEGRHTVSIQKEGYVTKPAEKILSISANDTSLIYVQQTPFSRRTEQIAQRPNSGIGTIDVSANVLNGRIYINGQDTGQETDYVFTKHPLGAFKIEVRKDGYEVKPPFVEVRLTGNNPSGAANFRMEKKFQHLRINASPSKAKIYVDDELKGEGSFYGELQIGERKISFGKLEGFIAPKTVFFPLQPGRRNELSVEYFPLMNIIAGVDRIGNLHTESCELQRGHNYANRAFTPSSEGAPEIDFNRTLNDYALKLGFAFPYRNPKGNDAVRMDFVLPQDIDYDQRFFVKIEGASSEEKYPQTREAVREILIKINNYRIGNDYAPKTLETLNGLETLEWEITGKMKPGVNVFELSTTRENTAYYYLKKIEIYNK